MRENLSFFLYWTTPPSQSIGGRKVPESSRFNSEDFVEVRCVVVCIAPLPPPPTIPLVL